jgi:hypothetical protein
MFSKCRGLLRLSKEENLHVLKWVEFGNVNNMVVRIKPKK